MSPQELRMRFDAKLEYLERHKEMVKLDKATLRATEDVLEETRAILKLINAHIQMDEL